MRAKAIKLSGRMWYDMRGEECSEGEPWARLLGSIGEVSKLRKREGMRYVFSGGALSPIPSPPLSRGNFHVSVELEGARPWFVDAVFEAVCRDVRECGLSLTVRPEGLDFSKLREWASRVGEEFSSDREGSFTSKVTVKGQRASLTAHPKHGILNLRGIFRRGKGKPSEVLASILKEGSPNGRGI
ncbi:MAG: hypothetical protein QXQ76_06615 [Candidatus Bathyarchaeia archaeon]